MVSIYCIEDINDNKYIGSTIQELSVRFNRHKQDKRHNKYCSSSKLNLDYCIIYELESCKKKDRKEREQYWKDNTNCVNDNDMIHNLKKCNRKYYEKYKEQINRKCREYNKTNKDKLYNNRKEYYKKRFQYRSSWGSDKNNLLDIDLDLFIS